MPTKPPSLRARTRAPRITTNWSKRASRQERGYGRAHDLMRKRVLVEEPLCCTCLKAGRYTPTKIADHRTPKSEGGSDERSNYQGLCEPCHTAKTARESARAKARSKR
jgi:5-methylcytosine-specific restriction protein A